MPYKLPTDMSFVSVFDIGGTNTTTPAFVSEAKKPLGIRSSGGGRTNRLVKIGNGSTFVEFAGGAEMGNLNVATS